MDGWEGVWVCWWVCSGVLAGRLPYLIHMIHRVIGMTVGGSGGRGRVRATAKEPLSGVDESTEHGAPSLLWGDGRLPMSMSWA